MNKEIIVAGAGHGGLVAAYNLAKNGYSVTVYEKQKKEEMGHDWLDVMEIKAFANAGLPVPDDSVFGEYEVAVFNSPYQSVSCGRKGHVRDSLAYIDRKWLISYLIEACESVGVKFCFETGVSAAICERNKVNGILLENGEKVFAPLVIDACGMNSPVRRSLPVECGIPKEIKPEETFFVYRAYYNLLESDDDSAKYNIFFFHCGKQGLDWVIKEKDAADLLIGGFGGLTEDEIRIAEESFRKRYDFIGDKIVRGGQLKTIPVRKGFSKVICDGYAGVGDSMSMVEPLSGSGITMSMIAGKILSETVINANTDIYTTKLLWDYQYRYFRARGNNQLTPDILKGMLTSVTADDIEYMFTTRFLTEKELGGTGKKNAGDILDKVTSVLGKPSLLSPLMKAALKLSAIKKVNAMMPEKYDVVKVRQWQAEYDKL